MRTDHGRPETQGYVERFPMDPPSWDEWNGTLPSAQPCAACEKLTRTQSIELELPVCSSECNYELTEERGPCVSCGKPFAPWNVDEGRPICSETCLNEFRGTAHE